MNKLLLSFLSLAIVLGGCNGTTEDIAAKEAAALKKAQQEEKNEETTNQSAQEETAEEQNNEEVGEIDTSVYEYAKSVEVTNSIDLTKHVNLLIDMSGELSPGMASQHVLTQTFDFLQQSDIEGAETVTVNVIQDGTKIFQFTTSLADFKPDDVTPMANLVVEASELDFVNPAVEEYGKTMEIW